MKRIAAVILLVLAAFAVLQFSGNLSVTNVFEGTGCGWQDLETDSGQTFSSIDSFQSEYPEAFDRINEEGDLRVQDGTVEYRLTGCTSGDFQ